MKKVLVLGTENACRSQMMAALIKHISFDRIDVESAGTEPKKMDPMLKKILQEIGIDITKETPKSINEFIHTKFDIVITTSDEARQRAALLQGSMTKIHKEFEDPRNFKGSELDRINIYRQLREEMNEWLNEFIVRHRLAAKVS